jgi:hypothetical protein
MTQPEILWFFSLGPPLTEMEGKFQNCLPNQTVISLCFSELAYYFKCFSSLFPDNEALSFPSSIVLWFRYKMAPKAHALKVWLPTGGAIERY